MKLSRGPMKTSNLLSLPRFLQCIQHQCLVVSRGFMLQLILEMLHRLRFWILRLLPPSRSSFKIFNRRRESGRMWILIILKSLKHRRNFTEAISISLVLLEVPCPRYLRHRSLLAAVLMNNTCNFRSTVDAGAPSKSIRLQYTFFIIISFIGRRLSFHPFQIACLRE